MTSKKSDSRKNIVVVGGGMGGLSLVQSLSNTIDPTKHTVTLIDSRTAVVHLISALRLVVSDADNVLDRTMHPYDRVFKNRLADNGTYIHGTVLEIKMNASGGSVILGGGERVDYDVLVLASGSKWPRPIDFPKGSKQEIDEHVKQRREEFANAKDILLVGGGAVGIELSGEIKDVWPDKPVTILHREKYLLNATYPDKYRIAMQRQLEARGITVLTNDSLESDLVANSQIPESGFVTVKGKKVKPDLVVPTWGTTPNTSFLSPDLLTSSGFVKVLPTLQLPGHPDVFAIGDIIDWKEQKTAAKVSFKHAPKAASNVLVYLKGIEDGSSVDLMKVKGTHYTGMVEMIVVTNGKSSGMGYFDFLWGITVGSWISSLLKSKDLGISRFGKVTGY